MTDDTDRASEKSATQRREDDVPLSEGAVGDGGAYRGGASPGDATPDDGSRNPLDAREHFGGDGAQFIDESEQARSSHRTVTSPDDDGYDPLAGRGAAQGD